MSRFYRFYKKVLQNLHPYLLRRLASEGEERFAGFSPLSGHPLVLALAAYPLLFST